MIDLTKFQANLLAGVASARAEAAQNELDALKQIFAVHSIPFPENIKSYRLDNGKLVWETEEGDK